MQRWGAGTGGQARSKDGGTGKLVQVRGGKACSRQLVQGWGMTLCCWFCISWGGGHTRSRGSPLSLSTQPSASQVSATLQAARSWLIASFGLIASSLHWIPAQMTGFRTTVPNSDPSFPTTHLLVSACQPPSTPQSVSPLALGHCLTRV